MPKATKKETPPPDSNLRPRRKKSASSSTPIYTAPNPTSDVNSALMPSPTAPNMDVLLYCMARFDTTLDIPLERALPPGVTRARARAQAQPTQALVDRSISMLEEQAAHGQPVSNDSTVPRGQGPVHIRAVLGDRLSTMAEVGRTVPNKQAALSRQVLQTPQGVQNSHEVPKLPALGVDLHPLHQAPTQPSQTLNLQPVAGPPYTAPVANAQAQPAVQQRGNQPGYYPVANPPQRRIPAELGVGPDLPIINQLDNPAELWSTPHLKTLIEHPLSERYRFDLCDQTRRPISYIQLCQVPNSFKTGSEQRAGFRWAVLLIIHHTEEQDKEYFDEIKVENPYSQQEWIIDPCARMEGREFIQPLEQNPHMRRRRFLRPRINLSWERTEEDVVTIDGLIKKMESLDADWRRAVYSSVMGVASLESLALRTGIWATLIYQLVYGTSLSSSDPSVIKVRNELGRRLESIGSRDLGVDFLHSSRHSSNQTN
ncbi:unnamed protein product [Rhizoctonia solani]|uniref:Uncharacterized protein n=1 Tax=Rhizoctonia solani TaxID=456999 RepID=A0A8H3AVW7_9AGAM|nr:unnamed protein product [Rhizoctonia solani]